MKKITLALLFAGGIALSGQAQTKFETTSIQVDGLCGMCEERIENAAYIPGVKKADWSQETHQLDLVFNPKKTSLDRIIASVNGVGHDVEGSAATDEQYANIHGCCRYRDEAVREQHHGMSGTPHSQGAGHMSHHQGAQHETTTAPAPSASGMSCNHAEGQCSGSCEHAQGQQAEAKSCNHAEGQCSGSCEHAHSQQAEAKSCNHAEGQCSGACGHKK